MRVGVFLFRILFASRTHVLLSTCVNSVDICMHISYTLFACIFNNSSAALFQYLYVRICVIHFNISFVFSGFELWHFYALVMYLERSVHKLLPICMSHTLCFSIDFFFVRFHFVILVFWSLARFLFRFTLLSAPHKLPQTILLNSQFLQFNACCTSIIKYASVNLFS